MFALGNTINTKNPSNLEKQPSEHTAQQEAEMQTPEKQVFHSEPRGGKSHVSL